MKKIVILGSPGSGKSTFAKKLHSVTGFDLYHLDLIWHKPDKTNISREEFDKKLQEILSKDKWIIDGNYFRTHEMRLAACDTVFLLDIGVEECIDGVNKRIGKKRSDLPWIETEFDKEFKQSIIDFPKEQLPTIYSNIKKYENGKNVIIFKSRKEIDDFLKKYDT